MTSSGEAPSAQTDALVERLFAAAIDTLEIASIHVGGKLGFYRALAEGGEEEFLTYLEALGVAEQIVRSAERSAAGLADSDQDPTVLE